MTQKWNLQDIKPAAPRRKRPQEPSEIRERETTTIDREEAEEVASIKVTNGTKKKRFSLTALIAVFVFIFIGGFFVSIFLGGAELTIYPKFREPNVNASFSAYTNPTADQLAYEVMTLEAEGERQVQASGEEEVSTQAEGTLFIYNNHQEAPIRLVTNTRFESENGLIYRIKDPAVVPGYTIDADGERVPGVVSAEAFADETGEEYNVAPGRFTIPGFAGEPEFENLYAETTESFTGGFEGTRFIIEDAELQTAQQALRTELRNSLLERVAGEKPAGFIVFTDAVTFTYETLPSVAYGDNLATIKERVYLRTPLFDETDFANFIAAATVPGYDDVDVRISDPTVLNFEYSSATTSSSNIAEMTAIDFKLDGRPQIVWEYDVERLKSDLLNKNRSALNAILGEYPAIERAEATIRPFWKKTFPIDMEEIEIIEIIEN